MRLIDLTKWWRHVGGGGPRSRRLQRRSGTLEPNATTLPIVQPDLDKKQCARRLPAQPPTLTTHCAASRVTHAVSGWQESEMTVKAADREPLATYSLRQG